MSTPTTLPPTAATTRRDQRNLLLQQVERHLDAQEATPVPQQLKDDVRANLEDAIEKHGGLEKFFQDGRQTAHLQVSPDSGGGLQFTRVEGLPKAPEAKAVAEAVVQEVVHPPLPQQSAEEISALRKKIVADQVYARLPAVERTRIQHKDRLPEYIEKAGGVDQLFHESGVQTKHFDAIPAIGKDGPEFKLLVKDGPDPMPRAFGSAAGDGVRATPAKRKAMADMREELMNMARARDASQEELRELSERDLRLHVNDAGQWLDGKGNPRTENIQDISKRIAEERAAEAKRRAGRGRTPPASEELSWMEKMGEKARGLGKRYTDNLSNMEHPGQSMLTFSTLLLGGSIVAEAAIDGLKSKTVLAPDKDGNPIAIKTHNVKAALLKGSVGTAILAAGLIDITGKHGR